jgi:hypothetical protein
MDQRVTDNSGRSRFEVFEGDELAGFAEYHRFGGEIAFIHSTPRSAHASRAMGSGACWSTWPSTRSARKD